MWVRAGRKGSVGALGMSHTASQRQQVNTRQRRRRTGSGFVVFAPSSPNTPAVARALQPWRAAATAMLLMAAVTSIVALAETGHAVVTGAALQAAASQPAPLLPPDASAGVPPTAARALYPVLWRATTPVAENAWVRWWWQWGAPAAERQAAGVSVDSALQYAQYEAGDASWSWCVGISSLLLYSACGVALYLKHARGLSVCSAALLVLFIVVCAFPPRGPWGLVAGITNAGSFLCCASAASLLGPAFFKVGRRSMFSLM